MPNGRDPHVDLFDLQLMHKIMREAGKNRTDPDYGSVLAALQKDLRDLAYDFLIAAVTTPFRMKTSPKHVTDTKRIVWLRSHVLKPTEMLLDALSDSNSVMLSEWPQDLLSERRPNRKALVHQLETLKKRIAELVFQLDMLVNDGGKLTNDFRASFALELSDVLYAHFPNLKPSRGTHRKKGPLKGQTGRYVEMLRLVSREIFPSDRDIPSRIIGDLAKM